MQNPTWRFRQLYPADDHIESADTEFFSQQDVAGRLVREAGQNTIDAVREGAVARLTFRLTKLPADAWALYFNSLWPHLEAQSELRESLPSRDDQIPCLVVEDYGTTGLTGPLVPAATAAAVADEKAHRLFWFFKNVGRTLKTGDKLGSFGIGKTVFPYSSRISTFFGYSVRKQTEGQPPIVLLGRSHLREHRVAGSGDLHPYGVFGWHDGAGANIFAPVSEPALLEEFRHQFGITRANDECGLSVHGPRA